MAGPDLSDHHVTAYLTNGTRDGVWTRRLVESVQRIVLDSVAADIGPDSARMTAFRGS